MKSKPTKDRFMCTGCVSGQGICMCRYRYLSALSKYESEQRAFSDYVVTEYMKPSKIVIEMNGQEIDIKSASIVVSGATLFVKIER